MPPQIAPLTSLRFFAAILVVVHHAMDYSSAPIHLEMIRKGGVAVDFFFILSGYILTHVYAPRAYQREGFVRNFIVARFAKIYPIHIFTLLLLLFFVIASKIVGISVNEDRFTASAFFAHVALLTAWGVTDQMTWNFPAWSISAEFTAYLLFPVLVLIPFKGSARKALCLLALCWLVFGSWFHLATRTIDFGVARIIPEFLGGMLLYRAMSTTKSAPYAEAQFLVASVLIILGLIFGVSEVWFPLAFGWIIAVAPSLQGPLGRILSHRTLVNLGEESYSLYMIHIFIFTIIYGALRTKHLAVLASAPHVCDLLAIAAAIFAARLSHRMIEIPAQTWIRERLSTKPSTSRLAAQKALG